MAPADNATWTELTLLTELASRKTLYLGYLEYLIEWVNGSPRSTLSTAELISVVRMWPNTEREER